MANICNNIITVKGPTLEVDLFMEELKKIYEVYHLDRPDDDEPRFYIDSRWVPPLEDLSLLSSKVPNIEIEIEYFELGCAFYGNATIKNESINDWSENMSEEKKKEYENYFDEINGINA